ncbi:MAG: hypothetical protein A2X18_13795 [Bacteroidetes bacterium GWF2_40_14]|nr:MAG: hypothetical protein A2X18_13795 [Bacteroidetes bacterium GWF2_40_14]
MRIFKNALCTLLVLWQSGLYGQTRFVSVEGEWQFRKAGDNKWLKATVPGTVHTDLLAAGLINDPYYRLNEKDLQWIDKSDWEYRTTLLIEKESFSKNNIVLRFEGLDTYADVWLNGKRILHTENMFRTWEVDIKSIVQSGENELLVLLRSPVNIGLEKLDALGYQLPASNDQSENGGLGDKRVSIFTRKAGYHFGWDWGPRLVTSGIWRQVKIVTWDNIRITDMFVKQKSMQENRADFLAEAEVQSCTPGEYLYTVSVNGKKAAAVKKTLEKGNNKVQLEFSIQNPEFWWPNGLGNQTLYDISVQVGQNTSQSDIFSRKIGVRTIKHIRKADKEGDGESFYFQVNGRPVFAKGANIIPNDIFLPSVTPEKYEFIIKSAAQANMNMLRVWGGGVYENDLFYDLCDKYGIMIWQDFMFACSMYPGDDAFLENVRLEAVDNVKRLRNHASLALWCGNNEIETAWGEWDEILGWGWKQQYDPERRKTIWHSYDTLFHKILPAVISEYTDGQPYWHSSPSKGYMQLAGSRGNKGDVHYWGVWHAKHPIEAFREYKARFMSEYGFQSFPEFASVKKYTLPEDWDIESKVMASHQRSGIGNLRIREYMEKSYMIPADFEMLLYTGQILQAEAIKMAIESHRTDMPFCMGSLYWQLNDCWPVASWSGIDSYLKWKALHYFAREAFKNTILTTVRDSNFVTINAVSDTEMNLDAVLTVALIDFRGNSLFQKSFNVKVPSNGSAILTKLPLEELLKDKSRNEVLLLSGLTHIDKVIDTDIRYFTEPKELILPKGDINIKAEEKDGFYYVSVSSAVLCKNIMIISDKYDVNFSDNFFDLLPGKEAVVNCKAQGSLEEFRRGLRVIKTESR